MAKVTQPATAFLRKSIFVTAYLGGSRNNGVVSELSPNGDGTYSGKVLRYFTFTGGGNPIARPVLDSQGNLYGTAFHGGIYGGGTAWKVTP
jgi:hypothetical protein